MRAGLRFRKRAYTRGWTNSRIGRHPARRDAHLHVSVAAPRTSHRPAPVDERPVPAEAPRKALQVNISGMSARRAGQERTHLMLDERVDCDGVGGLAHWLTAGGSARTNPFPLSL